jgi:hypothetical protein
MIELHRAQSTPVSHKSDILRAIASTSRFDDELSNGFRIIRGVRKTCCDIGR